MSEKYIRVKDAIHMLESTGTLCGFVKYLLENPPSYCPTYTPAEIMAGMWESVEKEYPPYLVWVLVTNGVEFEMAYRIKGAGWAHDGWVGCKNSDTITHWMPLPQPPKEAKHV